METLYKRTKTGAIQQWYTWSTVAGDWFTKSGQVGGILTNHLKRAKPKNIGKKNATTAEEQAQLESEAEWRSKHDDGYKTAEDLGIKTLHDKAYSWSDGSIEHFVVQLSDVLDMALPQFNSDASSNVKPMLAKPVNWKKVKYPCRVDPKYDGVRCLMNFNANDKRYAGDVSVTFLSRKGKEYSTLDHIGVDVRKHWRILESFILDGEIYSDELTFQEITAAVKKQSPDSFKLKFRVYDVVADTLQIIRTATTKKLVNDINSSLVIMTPYKRALTREDVMLYHDENVAAGYEGAMIRLDDGRYEQGFRSGSLMKVKTFDEGEFPLDTFFLGERKEDLMAMIKHNDNYLPVKMMGTTEYKTHLVEEFGLKEPIKGMKLTVKYQGLTDSGKLRFPTGKAIRDYE